MRKVKITENKPYKFSLRLTDAQYSFILSESSKFGISPSDFIRLIIDYKRIEREGMKRYENIKTY